jgi:uncharacterized membrane protein YfcA
MSLALLYLTFTVRGDLGAAYLTQFDLRLALGIFFAAFICEYFDSSIGMGYGTTLTPLLMILGFQPLTIVPAVMFSQMIAGLSAGAAHHTLGNASFRRGSKDLHIMLALITCSLLGGYLAITFMSRVPEHWVKLWIGALILTIGLFIVATRNRPAAPFSWPRMVALGLLASFNKGSSGGGYGPLVMGGQLLAGVDSRRAVAITALGEALTCVIYLVLNGVLHGPPLWRLALPLCAGAILSVPLAAYTVKLMPPQLLRGSIAYVTIFLGCLTLLKVLVVH